MTNRDYSALESVLQRRSTKIRSSYMKASLTTLRIHHPYMKHSFIYPYHNGRIEGINNIKVLHRVAYGYRNFMNVKNRIMLHLKLKPVEATCNTGHKETPPNAA